MPLERDFLSFPPETGLKDVEIYGPIDRVYGYARPFDVKYISESLFEIRDHLKETAARGWYDPKNPDSVQLVLSLLNLRFG